MAEPQELKLHNPDFTSPYLGEMPVPETFHRLRPSNQERHFSKLNLNS